MAIRKTELESWLSKLGPEDMVAVDEGGLTLLACDHGGEPYNDHYIEVGGVPDDDDDDDDSGSNDSDDDSEEDRCDCDGRGWFLCHEAGHVDPAIDGRPEVQSCDVCQKYDSDDAAARALFAYVGDLEQALRLAGGAPEKLYRRKMTGYDYSSGAPVWKNEEDWEDQDA